MMFAVCYRLIVGNKSKWATADGGCFLVIMNCKSTVIASSLLEYFMGDNMTLYR
jgi:hypothetical protein